MTKINKPLRWLGHELDYRFRRVEREFGSITPTEFISKISDAIGTGQPQNVIDELPPLLRQLHQEQDFHIRGNAVWRKIDPIAYALDTDNKDGAGFETIEADDETVEKFIDELSDREDVIQFLRENHAEYMSEQDAMNHADNGLLDIIGIYGQDEIIDAAEEQVYLDMSAYELLDTQSLNSPFCGLGYHQPRDKYEFRNVERRSQWSEKKDARDHRWHEMKFEASCLESEKDINAFYDNIRDDYYNDKELRSHWNLQAFKDDRAIYVDSLRRQGLDEETIRRKLWAAFDRKACTTPAIIKDGVVVKDKRVTLDSFWNKCRSEALQNLTLTTTQWSDVYNILKERRQWCRNVASPSCLSNMKKLIDKTENSDDLLALKDKLVKKNEYLTYNHRGELWKYFSIMANKHFSNRR